MKDSLREDAISSERDAAQTSNIRPRSLKLTYEIVKFEDYGVLRDIVSRYIGQLLYGCGDPNCTEILCETGRRSTSSRPVRKHTPRSARAIALTLASGPKPRSHLCPKYTLERQASRKSVPEGPRDPTSFVQQLCDTPSVRVLDIPFATADFDELTSKTLHQAWKKGLDPNFTWWRSNARLVDEEGFDAYFVAFHYMLGINNDRVFRDAEMTLEHIRKQNDEMQQPLCHCLEWLLANLPQCSTTQWQHVNSIISSGCAYPQQNGNVPYDPIFNNWLDLLDALEHKPWLQILSRLLGLLAKQDHLEEAVWRYSAKRAINDTDMGTSKTQRPCLAREVFTLVYNNVNNGNLVDKHDGIVLLLKKAFLRYWDGHFRVQIGTVPLICLRLLTYVLEEALKRDQDLDVMEGLLQIPVVAHRLDAVELAQTWLDGPRFGHLLSFSFLFNLSQEATYFRTMNHLRMRKANSDAEVAETLRTRVMRHSFEDGPEGQIKYLEQHYLLLNVSRGNVLQDAFDQLWQRHRSELLRPLRVRLGEMDGFEVGHDLGGVQIEFFNLVCKELLNESTQMFTTDPATGLSYFCPGSLQPLYMFELCGLLVALAIYNGISLPDNFPKAFYLILTGKTPNLLESIADGWPTIKRSLETILKDDITGLEYTFPMEANGVRLTVMPSFRGDSGPQFEALSVFPLPVRDIIPIVHHENEPYRGENGTKIPSIGPSNDIHDTSVDWPGWQSYEALEEPEEITERNKAAYVRDYVKWLTHGCVKPQWHAFQKGFDHIFANVDFQFFRHLQLIVEGSTQLDISELRRITTYDGYEPTSKYIQNFWRLVISWPEEQQKQLLKFVTACERVPPGGASNLTFKIQRATPINLDQLPTSSTCFGTLMLPKYSTVEILDKKLSLALKYGMEGFGTG